MIEKYQSELLQALRDMVAVCEMDEAFGNPEGGNWDLLRRAKILLRPTDYLQDHPAEALYAASLLPSRIDNETVCNLEAILKAAETLPENRFDMRYFGHKKQGQEEIGCLIWWHCRQNPQSNLRLELEKFSISATKLTPWYHTLTGLNAIQLWLGLDVDDTNFLFDHDYYPPNVTKAMAVNRVSNYLKSGGWINKEINGKFNYEISSKNV